MASYNNTVKNQAALRWESNALKLKICGMKLNTAHVAALHPDYLGFIFWKNSKRNFTGPLEAIPQDIKKVGVFVNASISEIKEKVSTYDLAAVQLHGDEPSTFCEELKREIKSIQIIKVFSIKEEFDFDILLAYEGVADYYLFDTKGKLPGGNGYTFNWDVLKGYPSEKPYFLSGGIGLEELSQLKSFFKLPASKYCHAIDVNSKFEIALGLKDINLLQEFKKNYNHV